MKKNCCRLVRPLRFVQILMFILLILHPGGAYAASGWSCFGATLAEWVLPGLGYGLLGHYDKMFVFGSARWAAWNKYYSYSQSPDYQSEWDQIYRNTSLGSGRKQTDVYYSRSTFYGNSFKSIYSNLTFVTYFDLIDGECEENPETYNLMLSPFRFGDYGKTVAFWVPTAFISTVPMETELITYHVDGNLTRDEMLLQSFFENQLTGIGEEMIFRGLIQRSLFDLYSLGFERNFSRWSSIVSASVIFGLAHSGQGFTSSPLIAFLYGIGLGWVYHPADGEFELVQPIAIHSWWNTIGQHRRIRGANFVERGKSETAQTSNSYRSKRYSPLFSIRFRF